MSDIAVVFRYDPNACEPTLTPRTGAVRPYSWGDCRVCREVAQCEGQRDILEGSMWCAAECPRHGPWACQERETPEMVAAWRAWAVAHFALMARDAERAERRCPDWYVGEHPVVRVGKGETLGARVLA